MVQAVKPYYVDLNLPELEYVKTTQNVGNYFFLEILKTVNDFFWFQEKCHIYPKSTSFFDKKMTTVYHIWEYNHDVYTLCWTPLYFGYVLLSFLCRRLIFDNTFSFFNRHKWVWILHLHRIAISTGNWRKGKNLLINTARRHHLSHILVLHVWP
jgi:hypothetical protein